MYFYQAISVVLRYYSALHTIYSPEKLFCLGSLLTMTVRYNDLTLCLYMQLAFVKRQEYEDLSGLLCSERGLWWSDL